MSLIVSIFSALAVIIPLGIKLYKTVRELVEQKNWPRLVTAVAEYMEQAEQLFEEGADRKAWVMTMIQATADQLNYTLTSADIRNLEDLIDRLCNMSKIVNPPLLEEEYEEAAR